MSQNVNNILPLREKYEQVKMANVQKRFKCSVCEKYFALASTLKIHFLIHTGEKPFRCDLCNTTFTQAGSLKRHLHSHTGQKTHTCNVCHKQFSQTNGLKIHLLTHSGEKPHKCSICNKGFTHTRYLRRHMKIHGEPYKCFICSKGVSQQYLKEHLQRHTEKKSHKCPICYRLIFNAVNLRKHMLTHTNYEHKLSPNKTLINTEKMKSIDTEVNIKKEFHSDEESLRNICSYDHESSFEDETQINAVFIKEEPVEEYSNKIFCDNNDILRHTALKMYKIETGNVLG